MPTGLPAVLAATVRKRRYYGLLGGALAGLVVNAFGWGLPAGLAVGILSEVAPVAVAVSSAGPRGTLRANHLLAAGLAIRQAVIAAAVFGMAGLALSGAPLRWAFAGMLTFGLAGLVAGESTWLRFRICQLGLAVRVGRTPAALPVRLFAFLSDGTHPDRATLRVNGAAWQFRHANIQDHLLRTVQVDLLRRRARSRTLEASEQTVQLLREQRLYDEAIDMVVRLRGPGNQQAEREVVELLGEQGNATELRRRADAGDGQARQRLVRLLRDRGALDEAIEMVRELAEAGNGYAERQMADLLIETGDLAAATKVLIRRAELGDGQARQRLAALADPVPNRATPRPPAGQSGRRSRQTTPPAVPELTTPAVPRQPLPPEDLDARIADLRGRSDRGDWRVHDELLGMLRVKGDAAELRRRAEGGDHDARKQLLHLLREREDHAELRRRSDAGDEFALEQLVQLRQDQGDLDAAIDELRRDGRLGVYGAHWLLELLRERGSIDELRRLAAAGDTYAREQLVGLLRDRGNLDEAVAVLRRPADGGDGWAIRELVGLLLEQGQIDEAIAVLSRRANAGDEHARHQVEVLRFRHRRTTDQPPA
ncbi:tetratricopeptide repeat protein [Actinoplanes sp. NPDC051411]|uniref:tetratricopeptide repeat protein n=1 Tax=Actinoplanes sp. NPDC051411 TaxID=3155522 RepID=UPI0034329D32